MQLYKVVVSDQDEEEFAVADCVSRIEAIAQLEANLIIHTYIQERAAGPIARRAIDKLEDRNVPMFMVACVNEIAISVEKVADENSL